MNHGDSKVPFSQSRKKLGVTVRLDKATHQRIVQLAERNERSVAFIVDRAVRDFLAKYDDGQLDFTLK